MSKRALLLFFVLMFGLLRCGGASDLQVPKATGTGGTNAHHGGAGEGGEAQNGAAAGDSGEVTAGAPNEATGGTGGTGGTSEVGGAPESGGAAGETGTESAVIAVEVTPSARSVAVGTEALLQATARYADGSTADVTARAAWESSAPAVASVAGGRVHPLKAGVATIAATLAGVTGSALVTVPSATVASLAVTPATSTVGIRGNATFSAVVTLTDGSTEDVSATATWSSSDPAIATVTGSIATGVAAGQASITASAGGQTASATLTVTSATLVSIAVTPSNPTTAVGASLVFQATGSFSDGSVADVSASASWSSSDSTVATLDPVSHGAKALAAGSTDIVASVGAISGKTSLTVTAASLTGITVTPDTSTLAVNGTVALTATGTYSDGTSVDLTNSATWTSENPSVASVSNASGSAGRVQGLKAGSSAITASFQNVNGTANVTVTAAALSTITVSPTNPTLPIATSQAFTALGTYSDGTQADVTENVAWATDQSAVATVSNAVGSQGRLTALGAGSTSLSATLGGVQGTTTVTVTTATLVSLAVTPTNLTLNPGATRALTATGTFSDSTTVDLTTSVVWSSSDGGVATVSNASGSNGTVAAIDVGTATVSATLNGVTGSISVTVAEATLAQLVIDPIAASVPVGQTVRYSAVAIYSDNSQRAVPGGATWASSDTVVATLGAANGRGGGGPGGGVTATTLAAGTTMISVTYQGVTGTTTLTATSATLSQLVVTPIDPTLPVGRTQPLVATAIYSDNTSQTVTGQATWQSSAAAVAAVSTGGGGPGGGGAGTVTAVASGTATISASWGGVTGTTTVTVTSATLVEIDLTPVEPSVALGTNVQFVATALYSDNTSHAVTTEATWTSSNPSVAQVSTAAGSRGRAQTLKSGTTTINATFDGVTGSTTLEVTSATLSSLEITPFQPTLLAGIAVKFVATGVYSDLTTADLTSAVTWTSSDSSVLSVSNAAATRGQGSPLKAGSATVSATVQGVTGKDDATVSSATITSLAVSPPSASIAAHAAQAFTATATLSDASTVDVTPYVTWLSSDGSIAAVSNASGSQGVATGLANGTVTITAARGSVNGTAQLSVQ